MKPKARSAIVIAIVGALLIAVVGAASSQEAEPSGVLTVINGASTDPVDVSAGELALAQGLEYAADGVATVVAPGTYTIDFTGGTIDSQMVIDLEPGAGLNLVSGWGQAPSTAAPYPVDIAPIDAGMAKVTVWNATAAPVEVAIDGDAPVAVDPGEGLSTIEVAANTPVEVVIDGLARTVDTSADSYTDVFAVNDGATPGIALAVIDSMTSLIEALAGAGTTTTTEATATVPIPDVTGLSAADAQAALEAAGFTVTVTEAVSDNVAAGDVIETNPAAGTEVATGTAVTIVVSTGPGTAAVPDVTGLPLADAQAALEAAGLTVTTAEGPSDEVEVGLVVGTNPAAGTAVAVGTSVTVTVSTGPGDSIVPDFLGMTVDEATIAASQANLTIIFVEDPNDPDPNGLVVSQDVVAGTVVAVGTEVTTQLSPAVEDPWTLLTLDPQEMLTVTGVNYLPGSITQLEIVGTTISDAVTVDDQGAWVARYDLSTVENEREILLVTGTAADGSPYQVEFRIPSAGERTFAPEEEADEGFPWWGWLLIVLGVIAIAGFVWWIIASRSRETAAVAAATSAETAATPNGESTPADATADPWSAGGETVSGDGGTGSPPTE